MKELFFSFEKALISLKEILEEEKTVITRDAAMQRFEFTTELAWKCIQKFLGGEKIICRSPRECLKEAFKLGLITDDPNWLKMFDDRNLTVHTYNENLADKIYACLPSYAELLDNLMNALKARDLP